jgi:hypothetical protein
VRLFASFDNRTVRPDEFVSWLAPDMNAFYQRGVRYFEIHNEPNLRPEGWTTSWNDGHEFGNWFIDVRTRLRQQFPQALLGYPGLSPGAGIPGLRMALTDFLDGSDEACRAADWVGLHCYWVSDQELNSAAGGLGYLEYRRRFPDKVLRGQVYQRAAVRALLSAPALAAGYRRGLFVCRVGVVGVRRRDLAQRRWLFDRDSGRGGRTDGRGHRHPARARRLRPIPPATARRSQSW